jgi:hypothetical protein
MRYLRLVAALAPAPAASVGDDQPTGGTSPVRGQAIVEREGADLVRRHVNSRFTIGNDSLLDTKGIDGETVLATLGPNDESEPGTLVRLHLRRPPAAWTDDELHLISPRLACLWYGRSA